MRAPKAGQNIQRGKDILVSTSVKAARMLRHRSHTLKRSNVVCHSRDEVCFEFILCIASLIVATSPPQGGGVEPHGFDAVRHELSDVLIDRPRVLAVTKMSTIHSATMALSLNITAAFLDQAAQHSIKVALSL